MRKTRWFSVRDYDDFSVVKGRFTTRVEATLLCNKLMEQQRRCNADGEITTVYVVYDGRRKVIVYGL